MEIKEIRPLKQVNAQVHVPGSKSYTQRALVIASLAEGKSILRNTLVSDDTRHLMEALRDLGAGIVSSDDDVIVTGTGGRIGKPRKGALPGEQRDGHAFSDQCRGPRVRRHHPDGGSAPVRETGTAAARGDPEPWGVKHLPVHGGLFLPSPSTAAPFGAGV